jgi:UDP-2,3-diacylglucosamine pyrophosphatase LpxH
MKSLRFRTVFISDVHLGTPDCKAGYLLDFLRRTACDTLYLVGDIIDLEAMARRAYWPAEHGAVLAEVLRKAETGTRVVYIPGNHDAALRSLCGSRIAAIEVCFDAVHVGADGRRFRVSHGDEFDPDDDGRDWLHGLGDRGYRFICWANRTFNRLRRRFDLPYLPLSLLAKSRIGRALEYIQAYENRVSKTAFEGGFDGHICGHIHFGAIRTLNGVLYCNDGDWVEHCTALTEDTDGRLELMHWSEQQISLVQELGADQSAWPVPSTAFAALGIAMGGLAPSSQAPAHHATAARRTA